MIAEFYFHLSKFLNLIYDNDVYWFIYVQQENVKKII